MLIGQTCKYPIGTKFYWLNSNISWEQATVTGFTVKPDSSGNQRNYYLLAGYSKSDSMADEFNFMYEYEGEGGWKQNVPSDPIFGEGWEDTGERSLPTFDSPLNSYFVNTPGGLGAWQSIVVGKLYDTEITKELVLVKLQNGSEGWYSASEISLTSVLIDPDNVPDNPDNPNNPDNPDPENSDPDLSSLHNEHVGLHNEHVALNDNQEIVKSNQQTILDGQTVITENQAEAYKVLQMLPTAAAMAVLVESKLREHFPAYAQIKSDITGVVSDALFYSGEGAPLAWIVDNFNKLSNDLAGIQTEIEEIPQTIPQQKFSCSFSTIELEKIEKKLNDWINGDWTKFERNYKIDSGFWGLQIPEILTKVAELKNGIELLFTESEKKQQLRQNEILTAIAGIQTNLESKNQLGYSLLQQTLAGVTGALTTQIAGIEGTLFGIAETLKSVATNEVQEKLIETLTEQIEAITGLTRIMGSLFENEVVKNDSQI